MKSKTIADFGMRIADFLKPPLRRKARQDPQNSIRNPKSEIRNRHGRKAPLVAESHRKEPALAKLMP